MTQPYSPSGEPYQPMPYGQPYPPVPQEHPQGTTVLVLGIVGIFFTLVAPIAWFLGSKAMKEIRSSGVTYSNEQMVNVGRILGMVFTIILIATLLFVLVLLVVLGVAASSSQ